MKKQNKKSEKISQSAFLDNKIKSLQLEIDRLSAEKKLIDTVKLTKEEKKLFAKLAQFAGYDLDLTPDGLRFVNEEMLAEIECLQGDLENMNEIKTELNELLVLHKQFLKAKKDIEKRISAN